MYNYEKFHQDIKSKKEEEFNALKEEINGLEAFFERCFKVIFECTSSRAERDFNVSSL